MIVGKHMQRKLITISPKDTIEHAWDLLKIHSIHHLPVAQGKKLVGVVSDRDLRMALMPWKSSKKDEKEFYYLSSEVTIEEIMTRRVLTAQPAMHVEDAAQIMRRNTVGCLPVVEGDELVGIITETDILDVFIEIMRVISASERIDMILGNQNEAFEEASSIIAKEGGEVLSVGMSPEEDMDERIYYFRIKTQKLQPTIKALAKKGFKIVSTYE